MRSFTISVERMKSDGRHWLQVVGLLVGLACPLHAGEFAPPAEGPVAFRRDQIPLDVDRIAELSRQLETLARGLNAETPADRRGAAQMLALAVALDPANTRARELISEYHRDRHKPGADADRLEKSRMRIWQTIAWLETPDAGSQGQALAACLKDVIVISDPKHPRAADLREGGEKGAWAGWIPPVSAYEPKQLATKEEPPPAPEPVIDPGPKETILLEQAEVHAILWKKSGTGKAAKWVQGPAPLGMTVTKSAAQSEGGEDGEAAAPPPPFSIVIGEEGFGLAPMANLLRNLLQKHHENLPRGIQVVINSKEFALSLESTRRQSVSAAAAVLASSAITGTEPQAVIIGQIDENGAFKLPTDFWDQLLALGKGGGRRLVLPADAAAWLPSVLALENPGFFMDYEVVLAADFKQLLEFSAKKPEGAIGSATAKFREIREKAGPQDIRQYISNTFVKQRLMTILQEVPSHVSSKMLLIQAAGKRPTVVIRPVLAAELRRALEPMAWIVKAPDYESVVPGTDNDSLGEIYDLCRSRVDGLQRYAEKSELPLVERGREVVVALRNLDRASRARGESYIISENVRSLRNTLRRMAREYEEELAIAEGIEPAAEP
jgi:hypothetical protein